MLREKNNGTTGSAPKAKRERARPPLDLLQMLRSWGGINPSVSYRGDITGESKGSFGKRS